jgi:transcriptional regulator with XRE-family HTH domain
MSTDAKKPMRAPAVPPGAASAIRANLVGLRQSAGLTQAELSAAAGLSPAAVGLIEQGRSTPSLGTLLALALALDVQPHRLFAGVPNGSKRIPKKS